MTKSREAPGARKFKRFQQSILRSRDWWVQHFAHNLSDVFAGESLRALVPSQRSPDTSAVVIGAGQSIHAQKHLELLAASEYQGAIICTDRMLAPALEQGITPQRFPQFYVVTVDSHPSICDFYTPPIVQKHIKDIRLALATTCAPKLVKLCQKIGLRQFWFNPLFGEESHDGSYNQIMSTMTKCARHPNGLLTLQTGGNAGTTGWVVGWAILARATVALIGIDFGFPADTQLDMSKYKHLLPFYQNEKQLKKEFRIVHNDDFDSDTLVDPTFDFYRALFCELALRAPSWVTTVNATEGGSLFGNRIEPMTFADFLDQQQS